MSVYRVGVGHVCLFIIHVCLSPQICTMDICRYPYTHVNALTNKTTRHTNAYVYTRTHAYTHAQTHHLLFPSLGACTEPL